MRYLIKTTTPAGGRAIATDADCLGWSKSDIFANISKGQAGDLMLGLFISAAAKRGDEVFDEDAGQFIAGSIDQIA